MKKRIFLITFVLLTFLSAYADRFDDVIAQLKTGSASGMVKLFNNSVELTLLDAEGIFSKQQAEVMLKQFFTQYPPKNVNLQHKGSSSKGAMYAIAIYESASGKFRAYIFMKDSGNGMQVNEFKIERE